MLTFLQNIDAQLLDMLRSTIVPFAWTHPIIIFFSDLEPIVFGLFLLWLWLFGVYHKDSGPKQVALDLFWHVIAAFLIYAIINQLLPMRPRPETIGSLVPLVSHLPDNSFPSGHALFWGASWWALYALFGNKKTLWSFFVLGGLTCFARILAGIHYPGDIIVGFLLGWGLMVLFTSLPHGNKYRNLAHTFPLKIASYFKL